MKIFHTFRVLTLLAAVLVPLSPAWGYVAQVGDSVQVNQSAAQPVGFHGATPTVQRGDLQQAYAGAATGSLTFTANPSAGDTVTLGTGTYTFVSALTGTFNQVLLGANEAASRLNFQNTVLAETNIGPVYNVGQAANASVFVATGTLVAATGTITDGNTNNVSSGDTATVGGTAYRFESSPSQIGDVQIGGNADASLTNLAAALNGTGTGTATFAGTPANAFVSSGTVTSHAITLTALAPGANSNTITLTKSSTYLTVSGSGTLAGGLSQVLVTAQASGTAGNSVALAASSTGISASGSTLSGGTASPSAAQQAVLVNELRDAMVQKGLIKGGP